MGKSTSQSRSRVPIYTHLFFSKESRRFGFPAGATGQAQKSRIMKKERKEHKGKLLSLSVLAQAEPGVWVISRKRAKGLHMEAPFFGCRITIKNIKR
ncbi:hypothetical protein ACQKDB_17855 [Planococcus kocurii]|uniref:hypothetical protein n=1 Tax=Planococcus kocurii TaxID=1374 RepID=UPI003CFFB92E